MPTTSELIQISITRQTTAVTTTGFSTPLILGSAATFSERVRTYTSLDGVEEDFASTDNEYIMAQKVFSQDNPPTYLKIGRTDDTEDTSITDSINSVQDYDNDWFFLLSDDHTAANQELLADWAEANKKIYITSTSDTDAYDAGITTDIGSVLSAKTLDNTMVFWSGTADTEFVEAAMASYVSTYLPGSLNWAYKTLSGITADSLTTTQEIVLQGTQYSIGKGYNTYTNVGGVNIVFDGHMTSGEYADIMRGTLALEARMRERIFSTMVNSLKIAFNSDGAALIRANMLSVLKDFSERGFIEPDYTVSVPGLRSSDYDSNLRANRIANGFTFTANLTGAINYVGISGTLIV